MGCKCKKAQKLRKILLDNDGEESYYDKTTFSLIIQKICIIIGVVISIPLILMYLFYYVFFKKTSSIVIPKYLLNKL